MSLRYPSSLLPRGGYETAPPDPVSRSASGIVAPTRCDERSSAPLQSRAASARYYLDVALSPRLLQRENSTLRPHPWVIRRGVINSTATTVWLMTCYCATAVPASSTLAMEFSRCSMPRRKLLVAPWSLCLPLLLATSPSAPAYTPANARDAAPSGAAWRSISEHASARWPARAKCLRAVRNATCLPVPAWLSKVLAHISSRASRNRSRSVA